MADNSEAFSLMIRALTSEVDDREVDPSLLRAAIVSSMDLHNLVQNVAEVLRVPGERVASVLTSIGVPVSVASSGQEAAASVVSADEMSPFPELFSARWFDADASARQLPAAPAGLVSDPFAALYRTDVRAYLEEFRRHCAPSIDAYLQSHFADSGPTYLVTTGIGANEQFCHFAAGQNNRGGSVRWLVITNPSQLAELPADATTQNTLFMEFSRSGVTEETVKLHEFTDPALPRIVFSNRGPLRELGERDGNLVLDLPDQVSGRYGRNKTPILLAPMYVCGMDVEAYWRGVADAVAAFDLDDATSLPVALAQRLRAAQVADQRTLIYLATNDPNTRLIANELEQYWNEGVNKSGNLLMVSTFQGLPRDSHMTIEGLLGNADSVMSIFLLNRRSSEPRHPLVTSIRPHDARHAGLGIADVDYGLAYANFDTFRAQMPTLLLELGDEPTMAHSAVLGQLFADMTFAYAKLVDVDPGSNPRVRNVRDRSAEILADSAPESGADA